MTRTAPILAGAKGLVPPTARNHVRQWRHKASRLLGATLLHELAPTPDAATGTLTSSRIDALLEENGGRTYLEVGVANGETLEAVHASIRFGVDPWPVFALDRIPAGVHFYAEESDRFFASLSDERIFDAVLLDGLHEFRQTYRDLLNALAHLSECGFILIDDTVPADSVAALPSQQEAIEIAEATGLPFPRPWMGDVYKVVYAVAHLHPEIEYYTYLDDERHQTVLWRSAGASPGSAKRADLAWVDFPDYLDEWPGQLPEWFHPATSTAIRSAFAKAMAH